MASWRFYQGLRSEWRWYHFDDRGNVIAESDQGFAELKACMANAEAAGFASDAYQVHARQSDGTIVEDEKAKKSRSTGAWNGSPPNGSGPQKQARA